MENQSIPNHFLPNRKLKDWPAYTLLLFALLTASRRLISTSWTANLTLVQTITIFGVIIGLALGYSIFNGRQSFLLGAAYAVIVIPWQIIQTMDYRIDWQERSASLLGRFLSSLDKVLNSQVVVDPILFWVTISLLFWVISTTAGYTLSRTSHPWRAILPAGIAITIIQTYDYLVSSRAWYLALFILFSILLVSRIYFVNQQITWKQQKTHTPMYASVDILRSTLIVGVIIIFISWVIPPLSKTLSSAENIWLAISEPWQGIRDEIGNAFNSLQGSASGITDYFGDNLPLGRGNALSDKIVLKVTSPIKPSPNIRLYWRSRVYDYFDPFDKGWETTATSNQFGTEENNSLEIPIFNQRWNAEFFVSVGTPLSVLYTAPQPISVSRPANFQVTINSLQEADIAYIRAEDPILSGETYSFIAQITNSSIEELQRANQLYPSWVTDKYLQIPDSVTERTIALAEEIKGDLVNPYEIANAITIYLRENITYTDVVPNRPIDQDPIDWILFDLKQGFCNYYATSEIILLRILGIPARMAAGYAEGEISDGIDFIRDTDLDIPLGQIGEEVEEGLTTNKYYTVRQNDVHAWPEVFFPGIGWVEFEPTSNQLEIVRAEKRSENLNETGAIENENNLLDDFEEELIPEEDLLNPEDELPEPEISEEASLVADWQYLLILIVATAAMIVSWKNARKKGMHPLPVLVELSMKKLNIKVPWQLKKWAKFASLSQIEKSYLEINKALKRIGSPAKISLTPKERADKLTGLLPQIIDPVENLSDQYQTEIYSKKDLDLKNITSYAKSIRKASYIEWGKIQFAKLQTKEDERGDLTTLMKK